jgi:hypothetical protein
MSRLRLANLGWVSVGRLFPACLCLGWLGTLGLPGCAAGYTQGVERRNDAVERRAAVLEEAEHSYESEAARAFEEQLLLTQAGTVISRSIRAHGGWDAWFALGRVTYVRQTIVVDYSVQPVVTVEAPAVPFDFAVDSEGKPYQGPSSDIAHEYARFALPFCLADPGLKSEYYGVETDTKTGQMFERVRYSRDTPAGSEWFIVWFDYSGATVSRLLQRAPDGKLVLSQFAERQEVAGVFIPAKRSSCVVTSVFHRGDFGRPDQVDLLVEIEPGN